MLTPFCETLPQTTIPAPESRILLEDTAEKEKTVTAQLSAETEGVLRNSQRSEREIGDKKFDLKM